MENDEKVAKIEEIFEAFSDRERIFVEVYCQFLSKKRAAEAAGIRGKNIANTGFQMYHRPHINDAIKKYLALTAITAEENIKLITRTAKTNISDYFIYVDHYEKSKERVPLKILIKDLQLKLDIEDAVLMDNDGLSKFEQLETLALIKSYQRKIDKYRKELLIDPKAYRIEFVERLVNKKVLNIDKLVEDRIPLKSVKYTKDGIQVETYAADAAQERLAKINGSFEADNRQLRPVINNSIGLTPEKLAKLSDEELKIMSEIERKLNA
jgi:phage terminase small subunit